MHGLFVAIWHANFNFQRRVKATWHGRKHGRLLAHRRRVQKQAGPLPTSVLATNLHGKGLWREKLNAKGDFAPLRHTKPAHDTQPPNPVCLTYASHITHPNLQGIGLRFTQCEAAHTVINRFAFDDDRGGVVFDSAVMNGVVTHEGREQLMHGLETNAHFNIFAELVAAALGEALH